MGYRENLYDLVLLLHVLSVVIGFGGVMLNGVYGSTASKMPGVGAYAITLANEKAIGIAEKFIYAVPVFGLLLVWMSDGAIEFGETWVWLALLVYAAAIVVSVAVMQPAGRRMLALQEEMTAGPPPAGGPPPQLAEVQALGKRLATFGPILQLAFLIVLVLMIFKPGGHVL